MIKLTGYSGTMYRGKLKSTEKRAEVAQPGRALG
jgi:hypothetical protein